MNFIYFTMPLPGPGYHDSAAGGKEGTRDRDMTEMNRFPFSLRKQRKIRCIFTPGTIKIVQFKERLSGAWRRSGFSLNFRVSGTVFHKKR